ncbi:MAG: hypothetical protein H6733_01575 [Alphaproteobacteria bacterium]|nr:hypothetical protein [Alphaproteobacteria bacterium]
MSLPANGAARAAWARLLAALGPIGVLGGAAAVGWTAPQAEQVVAMDAAVDRVQPDVVVVGNSLARLGVDVDALAEAVPGVARGLSLTMDGSGPATWEAVLARRVWARGAAPTLVVVPTLLSEATRASGDDAWDRDALALHTDDGFHAGRRRVRAAVDAPGRALAGWILAAWHPAAGADEVDAAVRRVLGEGLTIDAGGARWALPAVPGAAPAGGGDRDALRRVVAAARDEGAAVLVVWLPVRAHATERPVDVDAAHALTAALADASGVGVLDLSDLVLPAEAFVDDRHLAPQGQEVVTGRIGAYLRSHGGDARPAVFRFPPGRPPLVGVTLTRSGAPPPAPQAQREPLRDCCVLLRVPALAPMSHAGLLARGLTPVSPLRAWGPDGMLDPLGVGAEDRCDGTSRHAADAVVACLDGADGDALRLGWDPAPTTVVGGASAVWALPGTTLTWTLPAVTGTPEVVGSVVEVVPGRSASAAGGPPSLEAGAGPFAVARHGHRFAVHGALGDPTSGRVTWTTPADGAYAQLEALGLRWPDGAEQWFVGHAAGAAPRELALLDPDVGARVERPGPDVPVTLDGPAQPQPTPGLVLLPSRAVGSLSDRARLGRDPGAACNPVRVDGPDGPLGGPNADLSALHAGRSGYLLVPDGVLVGQGDGALTVVRTADLPRPHCRGVAWVHAGGASWTATVPGSRLVAGAASLFVRGAAFGVDGTVDVDVRVDDDVVAHHVVTAAALAAGVVLPLDPMVGPGDGEVTVALASPRPADLSVLLDAVTLREAGAGD